MQNNTNRGLQNGRKDDQNRIYAGAFIFLFLFSPCFAQVKTKDIVIGESYSFNPKNIEGTIEVSVHLPAGYEASADKYPVLYLLDIDQDFIFGSAVADFLADNDRIPGIVVLSVFLGKASGPPPALILFLENELFPFVEKSYRVQPCRVLYGHSARSFATLYVLLNRPDLFYGYICAGFGLTSPPWTTAIDLVKLTDTKLSQIKTLKKSLYFGLGNEQPFFPGVRKFMDILMAKAPKDLEWHYEYMPDDDHFSNKLKMLYNGLEFVFKGWPLAVDVAKAGLETVKSHYDQFFDRLGFQTGIPRKPIYRAVMNWLAYQNQVDVALALVQGLKEKYSFDCGVKEGDFIFGAGSAVNSSKFDDAIKIYAYLCNEHPESPAGFNGLGEVYEKMGKSEQALPNYEKAVRLAQANNDPSLKKYQGNLERVRKSMKKANGLLALNSRDLINERRVQKTFIRLICGPSCAIVNWLGQEFFS
jgi:predicted alpha/beta superfamily hydrolase